MKKLLSNKPWKKWKTRKFAFIFALVVFVVYTIVCIIMLSNELLLDSTLTTEVISFLKWVVTTGCFVVIFDKGTDCAKSIMCKHGDENIESEDA